jgi:hypothetical protein
MGFKEDKARILEALRLGRVLHEDRTAQEDKNLLDSGSVSLDEALRIIGATRGLQAASSPHHLDLQVRVWILKPTHQGVSWYIKCYLDGDKLWVLSFHT